MDLNKLTMGDKTVAGTGILLILGLLILPWHKVSFFGVSSSTNALGSPNGFWGILALLVTLAIVGAVLAEKLGNVQLPELPIPLGDAKLYAGVLVLALLLLKLVMETNFLGIGVWVNLILAAGLTYGGFLSKQEASSGSSSTPPSAF